MALSDTPQNRSDRALTEAQAAEFLGIAATTLRKQRSADRAARAGERLGPRWVQITARRVVYYESDLAAYKAVRREERQWCW